ncbi:photosynthetic NDH subunit of subcomplex B 1 chloroplastic [Prunus yedoensis var. nudiflora]|uniref:Photosynthetic NDH subunit of subcomplex B 1 chloroplastic n=1 Tax=Prunus yedoensis var. nudiflora TaxID=2094558 RepID=A0A314Z312_PRUYE|nr:photosynthetic NDH subunit of subcomplex B 1 chloroplastic [Prunus yedoensis var. nudiflora]
MATTTSLLPKPPSPFLTNTPSFPSTHFTKLSFLSPSDHPNCTKRQNLHTQAKKKNPWRDPFDDGEDPDMGYGSLFTRGSRKRMTDRLKTRIIHTVRGDVRRCCCVVSGGVYENLLFFPVIQLIKDRYPGVQVDVVASARGKQAYELNKNVRWADVYDPDDHFPEPAEYTDMVGLLKNRYYDMILSTKLAGIGHGIFLFMTTARERVSYIYPNVNAAGAGLFLSETFTPNSMNLSEGGFNMYHQMVDWLGRPVRDVPRQPLPPLKVSISKKLKQVVESKYQNAGVNKGKYIVIHGLESDSKASMQSKGDADSLLPIQVWATIARGIREFRPVFVIPHEKERENVEEVVGEDTSIVFMTTPGQLAALINDSAGVITTNTAAIQLANAREKPCIALFGSEEKGKLFVPNTEEKKNCVIVSSKTRQLKDIDTEAVKRALQIFKVSLALV